MVSDPLFVAVQLVEAFLQSLEAASDIVVERNDSIHQQISTFSEEVHDGPSASKLSVDLYQPSIQDLDLDGCSITRPVGIVFQFANGLAQGIVEFLQFCK